MTLNRTPGKQPLGRVRRPSSTLGTPNRNMHGYICQPYSDADSDDGNRTLQSCCTLNVIKCEPWVLLGMTCYLLETDPHDD